MPFQYSSAAMNMAIDESIGEAISFNEAPPTIRFYGWKPSAVSIGCFQPMADEVDLGACKRLGVDRVRRRTGGGAVYHDEEGEITYSVICPERMMAKDIGASYKDVCGWIVHALRSLGLEAEFHPVNDVLVRGRKISGSAQTRRNNIFTQHGTILHKVDRERMFQVLKVGRTKISDKAIKEYGERVVSVSELVSVDKRALLTALVGSFIEGKSWYLADLGADEVARAEVIASDRYARDEWNLSR